MAHVGEGDAARRRQQRKVACRHDGADRGEVVELERWRPGAPDFGIARGEEIAAVSPKCRYALEIAGCGALKVAPASRSSASRPRFASTLAASVERVPMSRPPDEGTAGRGRSAARMRPACRNRRWDCRIERRVDRRRAGAGAVQSARRSRCAPFGASANDVTAPPHAMKPHSVPVRLPATSAPEASCTMASSAGSPPPLAEVANTKLRTSSGSGRRVQSTGNARRAENGGRRSTCRRRPCR